MKELQKEFLEILNRYKDVSIFTHKNPDGDTISSALALAHILKKINKRVEVVCKDFHLLPQNLNFLAGFDTIKKDITYKNSLIIMVDGSSIDRFGISKENLKLREIINFDHHATNEFFGKLNIVDSSATSCAMVIFEFIESILPLTKEAAEAIFCGMYSDTQGCSIRGVGKREFVVASKLIESGVDPAYVAQNFKRRSLSFIRLLSRALDSLTLVIDGRVSIIEIRDEDLKSTNASFSDILGIVDYGLNLFNVEVAILLAQKEEVVKVSLRSKELSIVEIALEFGGGGHKNAAGFEFKGSIEEIREILIKKFRVILKGEESGKEI